MPLADGAAADRLALLTRPAPDNSAVAEALAADGIATAIWPLTRIVALPGRVAVPPGTGGLIFTSRNAVRAFAAAAPVPGLRAWCVGDRTAHAAREAGFADVVSAGGDVAALARLLSRAPPARLLYLRGEDVAADLPALLNGSGHRIDAAIVYRARPAGPPPPAVAAALGAGRVGAIALWSRLAATVLAGRLAENPGWPVAGMRAVAISRRAAAPLEGRGLAALTIAASPDGPSMLAAIRAAMRQ